MVDTSERRQTCVDPPAGTMANAVGAFMALQKDNKPAFLSPKDLEAGESSGRGSRMGSKSPKSPRTSRMGSGSVQSPKGTSSNSFLNVFEQARDVPKLKRDNSNLMPASPPQPLRRGTSMPMPTQELGRMTSDGVESASVMEEGAKMGKTRTLLRLTNPQSKLRFLQDHPFFKDTSTSLRERLAPQLVRRSQDKEVPEGVAPPVVEQGAEPTGNTDYLFLTGPESHTRLDVMFDGKLIAALGDSCVFGQEAIFKVSKSFLFSIRVSTGSVNTLWVIPRSVLQSLLQRDQFRQDAAMMKDRADMQTVALLHNWYSSPSSHINLKLFQNADHAFKSALIQSMQIQICAAGSRIISKGDQDDALFCVFRGEAHVVVPGSFVAKLSHLSGTSAWAAWWGLLEGLGVCKESPAQVTAVSDSIVWKLKSEQMKDLRKQYPVECRLFDKVAIEHLKMLQPSALQLSQLPMFKNSAHSFLEGLSQLPENRVCAAGECIIRENNDDTEMFFLARGHVEVRKQESPSGSHRKTIARKSYAEDPKVVRSSNNLTKTTVFGAKKADLSEGSVFGEMTALGCSRLRTASVFAMSLCDLREFESRPLVDLLEQWPDDAKAFMRLVEDNGFDRVTYALNTTLREVPVFEDFNEEFLRELEPFFSNSFAFVGQLVFEQGSRNADFQVLVHGSIAVEVDDVHITDIEAPAFFGESLALADNNSKAGDRWFTARSSGCCVFLIAKASRLTGILTKAEYAEDRRRLEKLGKERIASLREKVLSKPFKRRDSDNIDDEEDDGGAEEEELEQKLELLGNSEWFRDGSLEFRTFVARQMEKCAYFSGQMILQEGDEGDWAFIVESGDCTVEVNGTRVGEVKSGGLVGEAAAMGLTKKRTATVTAATLVTGSTLSHNAVTAAFEEFPEEEERVKKLINLRKGVRHALAGNKDKENQAKPEKEQNISSQRRPSLDPSSLVLGMASARAGQVRRNSNVGRTTSVSTVRRGSFNVKQLGSTKHSPSKFSATASLGSHQMERRASGRDLLTNAAPLVSRRGSAVHIHATASERPSSVKAMSVKMSGLGGRSASPVASSTGASRQGSKSKAENGAIGISDYLSGSDDSDGRSSDSSTALSDVQSSHGGDLASEKAGEPRAPSKGGKTVAKKVSSYTPIIQIQSTGKSARVLQPEPNRSSGGNKKKGAASKVTRLSGGCLTPQASSIDRAQTPQAPQTPRGHSPDDEATKQARPCPDLLDYVADDLDADIDSVCDLQCEQQLTPAEEWARDRREKINAAWRARNKHMAKTDRLVPLLPPYQGYKAARPHQLHRQVRKPYIRDADEGKDMPWRINLKQAAAIYGSPVWHEFYG